MPSYDWEIYSYSLEIGMDSFEYMKMNLFFTTSWHIDIPDKKMVRSIFSSDVLFLPPHWSGRGRYKCLFTCWKLCHCHHRVQVRAVDADFGVLAIAAYPLLPLDDMWVSWGVKEKPFFSL